MSNITVTLPDGSSRELPEGSTALASITERLTDPSIPESRRDIAPICTIKTLLFDTLVVSEIRSLRQFVIMAVAVVATVALALPFLNPDPVARWVLIAGLLIVLTGLARAARTLRDPQRYRERDTLAFGLSCLCGAIVGFYYFGFFSPAPLIATTRYCLPFTM